MHYFYFSLKTENEQLKERMSELELENICLLEEMRYLKSKLP